DQNDEYFCNGEYQLNAEIPVTPNEGYWQCVSGDNANTLSIDDSKSYSTTVSGLQKDSEYKFLWTVESPSRIGHETQTRGCSATKTVIVKPKEYDLTADNSSEVYEKEGVKNHDFCSKQGTITAEGPEGGSGYWELPSDITALSVSTLQTLSFDLGDNKTSTFTWHYEYETCREEAQITVNNIKPKAETEQPVYYACGEAPVTLSGKLPENTTGEWSKSSSIYEGAFVGATDIYNAQYKFASNEINTSAELEWTVKSIEDPYCYTSTTVTVKNNHVEPTITASNYVCGSETSVEGTIPESGFNGYWICTSSTLVTFDESTNKQTTVKNLQPGENTIQWTVFNAEGEGCYSVSEEYVIENIKVVPTVADVDPTFDGTFSVNLSAGSLSDYGIVGSDIFGRWETVSAPVSVNILNSTNNETEISELTETGDYEFKWVVYRKIDGFPEETGYSDGGMCHTSATVSFKYEVMKLLVDASGFEYGLPVYPKVTTIQGLDVTEDCEKLYTDENGQPVLTDLALTPVGKYTLKASYLGVTSSTTFNISPRHVTPEITLSQTEVVYDGGEKTPEIISVAFDGIDLLNECGEPLYQNNRNVGMATVTITNKSGSNYTFSKSVNFFINAIPFEYLVGKRAVVKIPVSTTGLNFSSDNKDISVVFRDGGYCVTTSKNVKKGDIAHIKSTIVDIVVTVADPFENFFDDSKWYNTDIALKTPENSNGWILSLPDYTDNTVTQEGENNVKCQILDDEENIIAEESYLIKIDKTAPEISVLADGHGLENSKHYFLRSGAEFSAAAKDNFSGVETLEYSWDNEIFKQYDEKITLPYGKSSVYVRSKDVAGNQTETLKADFSVFEDSKFALNNSDEITSDTIFYSSKNISDMSFEINLNGNTIGSVTDASGTSFNFSDNVITVKKEYLETLSPGIHPLYVRINPLGEKSAWDGGNPADFDSETMTINLDVKYIVTIDKRYDFALLTDPDVKIFCPGDNVVMSFDFDEDCSSADFITVKLLGIEKETPDGGINFQVPFDGLRGGKESLAIEFYKDGYVFEDSVVFSANYPSERTFRVYDDVLALDNFDRQFVDSCYKWYIDNKEIDSANAQFLDLTKVIFDNEQHVFTVSVLDKDGNRFRVCPDEDFVVTPSVSKRQTSKVKTYPNPAVSRQPVYIELKNFAEEDFSDSEIWIYNQLGGLVQKVSEVGERTAVVLPSG
ncbi:MAG: X2-like carbohydrate binding domain-containing protein, partial [Bacteroidales bacterium]|nr:X2-like carbohydrate binding domain-containing protein [Bacteroidales bacterium]